MLTSNSYNKLCWYKRNRPTRSKTGYELSPVAYVGGGALAMAPPFWLCLLVKKNKINGAKGLKYARLFW